MKYRATIKGISYALPRLSISNDDQCFSNLQSLSDDWWDFWGIDSRRMIKPDTGESELELASQACLGALENAGVAVHEVDLILANITSPFVSSWENEELNTVSKQMFPRLSCFIKDALGANNALNWDVEVECASFIFLLQIAANFIKQGRYKNILICSCEYISGILDFTSKSSTTFGDGAAAALVTVSEDNSDLLASSYFSDAALYDLATIRWRYPEQMPESARSNQDFGAYFTLAANGQEQIARFMPNMVPQMVEQALDKAGLTVDDIACFVFHQPSKVLVETWARKIGAREGQYIITLDTMGCLVSASIAVTLYQSVRQGLIKPGSLVVLAGAGAGWGYAAQVWRFDDIVAATPKVGFLNT